MLGLQCGGSDAWSGVTSNPALGDASDRLAALGGTVILSETPEIYGAEHLLYARARSPEVSTSCARGSTGGRTTPASTARRWTTTPRPATRPAA